MHLMPIFGVAGLRFWNVCVDRNIPSRAGIDSRVDGTLQNNGKYDQAIVCEQGPLQ